MGKVQVKRWGTFVWVSECFFQSLQIEAERITASVIGVRTPLTQVVTVRTERTHEIMTRGLKLCLQIRMEVCRELCERLPQSSCFENVAGDGEAMPQFRRIVQLEEVTKPQLTRLQNSAQANVIGVVVDSTRRGSAFNLLLE